MTEQQEAAYYLVKLHKHRGTLTQTNEWQILRSLGWLKEDNKATRLATALEEIATKIKHLSQNIKETQDTFTMQILLARKKGLLVMQEELEQLAYEGNN